MGGDLVADRGLRAADAVDRDDLIAGATSAAEAPLAVTVWTVVLATDWPFDTAITQKITKAITRFTAGPARITTTRFHTFWL